MKTKMEVQIPSLFHTVGNPARDTDDTYEINKQIQRKNSVKFETLKHLQEGVVMILEIFVSIFQQKSMSYIYMTNVRNRNGIRDLCASEPNMFP